MKKLLYLLLILSTVASAQIPSTVTKLKYNGILVPNKPAEYLYGVYTGKLAALTATAGYRYKGMTVGIDSAGTLFDYQFKTGITDADLVLKSYSSSEADGRFVHLAGNENINGNKYFGGGSLTSIDNLNLNSMLTNYNGFVGFNAFNSTLIPLTASDMQSRLGYLTSENDTYQSVTDRGNTTTNFLASFGSGVRYNWTNTSDVDMFIELSAIGATDKFARLFSSAGNDLALGVDNTEGLRIKHGSRIIQAVSLAGTGTRVLVADSVGNISATPILASQSEITGDGTTTIFTVAHSSTGVTTASHVYLTPRSADAATAFAGYWADIDATNITLHFTTAPANSADVIFDYQIIK